MSAEGKIDMTVFYKHLFKDRATCVTSPMHCPSMIPMLKLRLEELQRQEEALQKRWDSDPFVDGWNDDDTMEHLLDPLWKQIGETNEQIIECRREYFRGLTQEQQAAFIRDLLEQNAFGPIAETPLYFFAQGKREHPSFARVVVKATGDMHRLASTVDDSDNPDDIDNLDEDVWTVFEL